MATMTMEHDLLTTLNLVDARGDDVVGNAEEAIFHTEQTFRSRTALRGSMRQFSDNFRAWRRAMDDATPTNEQAATARQNKAKIMDTLNRMRTIARAISNSTNDASVLQRIEELNRYVTTLNNLCFGSVPPPPCAPPATTTHQPRPGPGPLQSQDWENYEWATANSEPELNQIIPGPSNHSFAAREPVGYASQGAHPRMHFRNATTMGRASTINGNYIPDPSDPNAYANQQSLTFDHVYVGDDGFAVNGNVYGRMPPRPQPRQHTMPSQQQHQHQHQHQQQ